MQTGAIVMMVAVLGVLWGGFAVLLVRAVRIERRKAGGEATSAGMNGPGETDGTTRQRRSRR